MIEWAHNPFRADCHRARTGYVPPAFCTEDLPLLCSVIGVALAVSVAAALLRSFGEHQRHKSHLQARRIRAPSDRPLQPEAKVDPHVSRQSPRLNLRRVRSQCRGLQLARNAEDCSCTALAPQPFFSLRLLEFVQQWRERRDRADEEGDFHPLPWQ